jgi:tryptophan synthase alpha chain
MKSEIQSSSGLERIRAAFARAKTRRSAALMPYFTLGYPDPQTSLDVVRAIAPYSDLLELGVPFSDPIADGPTIQRSTQRALEAGTTPARCLEMVEALRQAGVSTPSLLMGYYNPILAYGEERYVRDAAAAGADGLIVPDLPPEEARTLAAAAAASGLALIYFLAPTSNQRRVGQVIGLANGFIYMVSVTGITGARSSIRGDLAEFVAQLKERTEVPVAVGFGISTPEQARVVGSFADGVIVGSALINVVAGSSDQAAAAAHFVRQLAEALSVD